MGNSFGHLFRITTFGESHGGAVGVVIDGCPPRVALDVSDIQAELDRRKPGQSHLTTARREPDRAVILSGLFEGQTLGSPISIVVYNQDARPEDYAPFKDLYRPSHADYTTDAKYGIRNWQGGGRASARETIGRVAAGAVARKILHQQCGVDIIGFVRQIHTLRTDIAAEAVRREMVEASLVRCPDAAMSQEMEARVDQARRDGDSVGGIIECVATGVPPGWGEPVFDKLEADLAKAMLSIPAAKGFEVGLGFAGAGMTGLEHNDAFYAEGDRVRTRTNHSGGIQGGISNGEVVVLRVAFKPTATVRTPQQTVDTRPEAATIAPKGRHDPCVLPRAVPIVEAMTALVLVDHFLRQRGQCGVAPPLRDRVPS